MQAHARVCFRTDGQQACQRMVKHGRRTACNTKYSLQLSLEFQRRIVQLADAIRLNPLIPICRKGQQQQQQWRAWVRWWVDVDGMNALLVSCVSCLSTTRILCSTACVQHHLSPTNVNRHMRAVQCIRASCVCLILNRRRSRVYTPLRRGVSECECVRERESVCVADGRWGPTDSCSIQRNVSGSAPPLLPTHSRASVHRAPA